MYITLYSTTDDKRVIDKTLTSIATYNTIDVKRDTDILNPTIIIEYSANNFSANYCYISLFDRYYYITNITVLSGGRIAINCKVDVLKTYATEIKALNAIRTRAEIQNPTEITDNHLPLKKEKKIRIIEFTGGDFNINVATNYTFNFVINIAGGGAENVNS